MEIEPETAEVPTVPDTLARRLANGGPSAPGELVERHHPELYRYARALMRDAPAAEDAVQEAFERAFAALGKYPKERIESLFASLAVPHHPQRNTQRVAETSQGGVRSRDAGGDR
jgi:RNA polymerase sigma-70 factor (ECF subfamily)